MHEISQDLLRGGYPLRVKPLTLEQMKSMAESGYQLYKTRFSKEAYLQDIIPVLENTAN